MGRGDLMVRYKFKQKAIFFFPTCPLQVRITSTTRVRFLYQVQLVIASYNGYDMNILSRLFQVGHIKKLFVVTCRGTKAVLALSLYIEQGIPCKAPSFCVYDTDVSLQCCLQKYKVKNDRVFSMFLVVKNIPKVLEKQKNK